MIPFEYLMILALAVLVGWLVSNHYAGRAARRTLAEFQRRFPGRCPICSFHRYGLTTGATSEPVPEHRDCPELTPTSGHRP